MKALLIPRVGEPYFQEVADDLKGKTFSVAGNQIGSVASPFAATVHELRSFQWHGHVVRRDGSHLFDVFEEL